MVRLDHIGIAIRDLAPALKVLEDVLGIRPYKSEDVEPDHVRTHFLRSGTAKLELLESLDESSPIARFLDKRGEGLHHLAFEVEDIKATYRRIDDLGYRLIDAEPRDGADGKRIFFLHPKDTAGILFEFCQTDRPVRRPAGSAEGLRLSTAGGGHLPRLVCLQPADSDDPRDDLIRTLEQCFSVLCVELPDDAGYRSLEDVLGDRPMDLLAVGRTAWDALRYAQRASTNVSSLVLYHPDVEEDASDVEQQSVVPESPILIIARDDRELDTALKLRTGLPTCRLAVLPADEPATVARLIERHAESAPDR